MFYSLRLGNISLQFSRDSLISLCFWHAFIGIPKWKQKSIVLMSASHRGTNTEDQQ